MPLKHGLIPLTPEERAIARQYTIIKNRYGLDKQEYDLLKEADNGACWLCYAEAKLVIDHDHETNTVRGLICYKCNTKLKYIENTHWCGRAAWWLSNRQTDIVYRHSNNSGTNRHILERLMPPQPEQCNICRAIPNYWVVDHDHNTGMVRGWLCQSCNVGLEIFDNTLWCLDAHEWICNHWMDNKLNRL